MAARLALTVLALAACSSEARDLRARADSAGAAAARSAMALDGQSAGCLRVGTVLSELASDCALISRDTVPGPEGFREDRVEVRVGRDTVEAVLVRDTVWRIEVTRSGLTTDDGLGVGTAARTLLDRPASRVIGGEGNLFVIVGDRCGMSFELGGLPPEVKALAPDSARDRIPEGTSVSRVLIFGCPVE